MSRERFRKATARRGLFALVGIVAAISLAIPSWAVGALDVHELGRAGSSDFDVRKGSVAPSARQVAIAEDLGATVRWNRFGTPQSMIKYGGYLAAGLQGDSPAAVARSWIDANKELFKLSSTDYLRLESDGRLSASNAYVVVFRQEFGGLPAVLDGVVSVGVVGTREDGWKVAYVSSLLAADAGLQGSVQVSAAEAWKAAATHIGRGVSSGEIHPAGARSGWTRLSVSGFDRPQFARRVALPSYKGGAVPAFETVVVDEEDGRPVAFQHVIDARNGRVLVRLNTVDHAVDDPQWEVFEAYPEIGEQQFPWNYPSTDTRKTWCWEPAPGCDLAVANDAARVPWDVDARTNTPTFTTIGNAARTAESWFNPFFPGPTQFRPVSPTRDYLYPWTNVWFENACSPENLDQPGIDNDISAATTNLFAMHNRMHDWSYFLGFTEEHWNAQDFNFGEGTAENDPLIGDVQAGAVVGGFPNYAGRDNANMITLPDGISSITNMYLWQPLAGAFYAPCVDGDYDMSVIAHEYGHMIENRMIGKGDRRTGFHAGAMGESNGDLNAQEYLNEFGFVPVSGENPFAVGPFVTANKLRGIRNYGMNFPSSGAEPTPGVYAQVNPLNLGDVGYDITGPQVHADGEIWSATNFDIREALLAKYPGTAADQVACANGERPADQCPGNRRWIQIVYDAYLLMSTAPTFLDARDAYLAADQMRFGGANQAELWEAFAGRGFGQFASTRGPEDDEPEPDFESPHQDEATVTFQAVDPDEGGDSVSARIYVGHYEARVTPIADTTAGTSRDNVARFVPGTYEFIAHAGGQGHVRFRETFSAGETRTVTISMPTNHASRRNGATASGDGTRHNDLIDDTERSNWQSSGAPVEGRQVTVDLAGTEAHGVNRVQVSAMLTPGQNRFTALRQFEIWACNAGESGCSTDANYTKIFTSQPDAFPGDNPRPIGPVLILRNFDVPDTEATHVRIVVLNNQCTGQTSFHGEQDNDPVNHTDCRTGTPPPLPPRNMDVRIAELQVFSSEGGSTSE